MRDENSIQILFPSPSNYKFNFKEWCYSGDQSWEIAEQLSLIASSFVKEEKK